jgi:hypothetical protein
MQNFASPVANLVLAAASSAIPLSPQGMVVTHLLEPLGIVLQLCPALQHSNLVADTLHRRAAGQHT